jgi:hypothetical protein
MIIVSLFGGLGNQLFQYATGKAVAKRLEVELQLDVTHLIDRTARENFTYRNYELGVFQIKDKIATVDEARRYVPNFWACSEFTKKLFQLKRIFNGRFLYSEKKKFCFEDRILSVKDNSYLYGYFQSPEYFEHCRAELLNDLQLRTSIDEQNSKWIDKIKKENSVSIHVRRGDYLKNNPFQVLDVENYYRSAIQEICEKVNNPVFYIFTNDYHWAQEHFSELENKIIVNHNKDDKSYLDMVLMSNCHHNIIANSSFSWWGAWLNKHTDKIVIAPKNWFKEDSYLQNTYDLLPLSWIKI